ncbi:hypothetical protein TGAMA5MH_08546 [Trichoderma gamsii]|uniref:Amine oxidase domain-containing protein n=1 Tax=Trichoderma gamsii TaxID=398673 RepID=A0A2K0T1X5_9HYPO|nr:hypothetical protein TGAMA5MH_08546 [Trichoderma gamsii]
MHQNQPRIRPADGCSKSRVAIIGTGLAGLTTAYLLHQDKQKRYEVTLFEQAPKFSLDAASVTLRNEATGSLERVDIPPRSFCRGYYANLCRMYDHLGVSFQRIQLIWVFAKVSAAAQAQIPSADAAQTMPGSYFVYGKRLHELLLVSPHFWLRGSLQNVLLTFYLAVCHAWFFVACFFFPPRMIQPERYLDVKGSAKNGQNCESFRQYLDRIWLPQYYVLYFLLPILSIICSCSHAEMLDFPASDVTSFMKGSFLRKTYVAKGGINRVQATLAKGIQDVRLQTRVNKVERVDGGVLIRHESTQDERRSAEEVFDRVVLAVSPNVVAAIFNPSKPLLSVIPTVPVTSTVLASPNTKISLVDEKTHVPSGECSYRRGEAQIMAFRTTYSDSIVQTESLHYLEGGLVVRTSPSGDVPEVKGTLDTSRFTRTLRTTESRNMVRKAMEADDGAGWVNGKDDVWIVGSWCWDGMVLLEGCVVSAMRVARDLGVNVPW